MLENLKTMGFEKDNKDKEFVCKNCNTFLDKDQLDDGNCPNCETDEEIFINDEDYWS